MDGAELVGHFSFIVNRLRYCGPEKAYSLFLEYMKGNTDANNIRDTVKRFEGLYPYLQAIADKTGKDFLDYDVVEAYWLGNELLDGCNAIDVANVISTLMQRGLPKTIGERLQQDIPADALPHHLFHVLYVGVGRTTGTVDSTLQNMENCMISAGKVIEVQSVDSLLVETTRLEQNDGIYNLVPGEVKTAIYIKDMLPHIKVGDVVALHWGFAALRMTEQQQKNLEKYNARVLDAVNYSATASR
jgi:hydrogenase maturation factor